MLAFWDQTCSVGTRCGYGYGYGSESMGTGTGTGPGPGPGLGPWVRVGVRFQHVSKSWVRVRVRCHEFKYGYGYETVGMGMGTGTGPACGKVMVKSTQSTCVGTSTKQTLKTYTDAWPVLYYLGRGPILFHRGGRNYQRLKVTWLRL